jgi:outer membrane protein assembly factor BamE
MRIKSLWLILPLLLAACSDSSMPKAPSFVAHKIDIRQGNQITPDMREQVKVGMNRLQVRAALGTPLVSDPFHANRWDYVYRFEREGKLVEQRRLTVFFEGDNVARLEDGPVIQGNKE